MVDETITEASQDEGEDLHETVGRVFTVGIADDSASDASDYFGAEARRIVPGSTIEQVRSLIDDSYTAHAVLAKDPLTDTLAVGVAGREGIKPIPASFFDEYLARPRYLRGVAIFTALSSLIDHANRYKDENSALFANDDRAAPSLTSVIDYHEEGAPGSYGQRHGKHRGHFAFPVSEEWAAWTKHSGQKMKMAEFAAFVEERIVDVLQMVPGEDELPEDLQKFIAACGGEQLIASPQKLVELSRGLQVNESSVVASAVSLATGEGEVMFKSEHTGAYGEKLKVPGLFLLAIPVFRNDGFYRLAARLRYRKTGEGIVFWYDLYRADRVFDDAFKRGCERARVETRLPLFFGKPE